MTNALDVLLEEGVIDEVLGRLKSGKEADISLVSRGGVVMAAKVYKDRATRSFKNNADYKEGRKVRNSRTARAMEGGGRFGRDAAEQEWKSAEADALYKLQGSGVRVPVPHMFYEGVLLMDLVLDAEGGPAPRLIEVTFERDAVIGIYADLLSQMIAMLCCDLIHGDLSPYNILAAADGPTIIDFPQVISAAHSSRAEFFFLRDFDNVVRFLSGFDPSLSVHSADGRAIWRAYVSRELTPQFIPPPPPARESRGRSRRRDDDRQPQRPPNRRGFENRPSDQQRPPNRQGFDNRAANQQRSPNQRSQNRPGDQQHRPNQPRFENRSPDSQRSPNQRAQNRPGEQQRFENRSSDQNRPGQQRSQNRPAGPPRPPSPPRAPPAARRPPPVVAVRWTEDGPKKITAGGGRRRPKRRW